MTRKNDIDYLIDIKGKYYKFRKERFGELPEDCGILYDIYYKNGNPMCTRFISFFKLLEMFQTEIITYMNEVQRAKFELLIM